MCKKLKILEYEQVFSKCLGNISRYKTVKIKL